MFSGVESTWNALKAVGLAEIATPPTVMAALGDRVGAVIGITAGLLDKNADNAKELVPMTTLVAPTLSVIRLMVVALGPCPTTIGFEMASVCDETMNAVGAGVLEVGPGAAPAPFEFG